MREGSTDDEQAQIQSQSQDCEPPPPSNGSYTNLFDVSQDVPLGGSAHSLRNVLTVGGSHPQRPHYNKTRPSPNVKRATHNSEPVAPIAVPDQFSPSSPNNQHHQYQHQYHQQYQQPTYRQPKPPQAPSTVSAPVQNRHNMNSLPRNQDPPLPSDAKYPTTHALISDVPAKSGSQKVKPTKRSSSATQLNSKAGAGGVRTSPTYPPNNHHPHVVGSKMPPTGLASDAAVHMQRPPRKVKESGYSSSNSGKHEDNGMGASSLGEYRGPQSQSLDNVPGAIRRPMSFVKALEMSDALALQERQQERKKLEKQRMQSSEEKKGLYGSSYEISV